MDHRECAEGNLVGHVPVSGLARRSSALGRPSEGWPVASKGLGPLATMRGSALAHGCGRGGHVVLPLASPAAVSTGSRVLAQLRVRRGEHVQDVRQQGGRGLGAVRITQEQHLRGKPGCQWAEAGNQAANWPRLAEAGNRPELHQCCRASWRVSLADPSDSGAAPPHAQRGVAPPRSRPLRGMRWPG